MYESFGRQATKMTKSMGLEHKLEKPKARKRRTKRAKSPAKVPVVMHEFKKGTLHSGSGQKVVNRKQAVAIAMSEAGMSKKDKKC